MRKIGLQPTDAQALADTISPLIERDAVRAFRTGNEASAPAREMAKASIERVEQSLTEFAAPIERFVRQELSMKNALSVSGGMAGVELAASKGDFLRMKSALQAHLLPALLGLGDAFDGLAVKAQLAGFIAGLEASYENADTLADVATAKADETTLAIHAREPERASALHQQAVAQLKPALGEVASALAALAVVKDALT